MVQQSINTSYTNSQLPGVIPHVQSNFPVSNPNNIHTLPPIVIPQMQMQPNTILLPANHMNQPCFVQMMSPMGAMQQQFMGPMGPVIMAPAMNFVMNTPPTGQNTPIGQPTPTQAFPQQNFNVRQFHTAEGLQVEYEKDQNNVRNVTKFDPQMGQMLTNAKQYQGEITPEMNNYSPPEQAEISNVEVVGQQGNSTKYVFTWNTSKSAQRFDSTSDSVSSECIASPHKTHTQGEPRGRHRNSRSTSRQFSRNVSREGRSHSRIRPIRSSSIDQRRRPVYRRSVSREPEIYQETRPHRPSRPKSSVSSSSKRELVPQVKNDIKEAFPMKYKGREGEQSDDQKEGMRGPLVVRIKCTTMTHLNYILNFLIECDHYIEQVSCPNSQKKKAKYPQGFQCYIKGYDQQCVDIISQKYDEYQETHNKPFKKLELNPRSKAVIAAELASASNSVEGSAIPPYQRHFLEQDESTLNCESPPDVMAPQIVSKSQTNQTNWNVENQDCDNCGSYYDKSDYSQQGSIETVKTETTCI